MSFVAPAVAAVSGFMAANAVAITAVSAGVGALGAIEAGKAKASAYNYQAAVAKNNATVLAANADTARIAGQAAESQVRQRVGLVVGQELAAQGASGVDVSEGSVLKVRQSSQNQGEQDAQTVRWNAMRQAYGLDQQSSDQLAQAGIYKSEAKGAMTQGFFGAASSLIGGATSMAKQDSALKAVGLGSTTPLATSTALPKFDMNISGWDD